MKEIKRALISVSDKTGIVDLAKQLSKFDVEILSTGGTARKLKAADVEVREVSDYTGFPEMLDGRVKTLHPKIHGALLALRDNPDHLEQVQEHGIEFIDMVVGNLYPFEETISREQVELEEAIENIDIGGPTMIRSAAKNYKYVAVVTNPSQYDKIIEELEKNQGALSESTKFELAKAAFDHTSHYDTVISDFLADINIEK